MLSQAPCGPEHSAFLEIPLSGAQSFLFRVFLEVLSRVFSLLQRTQLQLGATKHCSGKITILTLLEKQQRADNCLMNAWLMVGLTLMGEAQNYK